MLRSQMLRSQIQMLRSQMSKFSDAQMFECSDLRRWKFWCLDLKCSNAQISNTRISDLKCSDLRRWEREFPPRLRPLFQVNWQYISQFDLEFNLTWNSRFLISNCQLNCQYISKFDLEFNILKFQRQMYSILNSQLVGKKSMINFYF